jgi:hypothetical protein
MASLLIRSRLFLRDQMCHFDELDFRHCLAADEFWAEYGMDAAASFLMGA